MTGLLFVYGSLRSDIATASLPDEAGRAAARLARTGRATGMAAIAGRLYAVDWYPGLVPGAASRTHIAGQLWRLDQPAATLAELDAYEGEDYRRQLLDVRTASGAILSAWVYVYEAPPGDAPLIDSGDYAHWIAQQTP